LLAPFFSPASQAAIKAATTDPDPLVRSAAPRALPASALQSTIHTFAPLLSDPIRVVRIEVARALAGTDLLAPKPEQQTAFVKATAELIAAENVDVDPARGASQPGLLYLRRQELYAAQNEYRTALRLDPAFVPAMVNLADLDRARGMDERGSELLRKALSIEPNNADVLHSLGLSLARKHDYAGALDLLRRANELAPDNARYAYVYAFALNSTGAHDEAIALLEQAHREHPLNREVLFRAGLNGSR